MNESKVGITQNVSDRKRFSALYWKYSDLQVNEIGMDGKVIYLTDKRIDVEFKITNEKLFTMEQQLAVLTAEQWENIENMIHNDEPKIVHINVFGKTTEERSEISKMISIKYEGLHCKTSNNILEISVSLKYEKGCIRIRDPPASSLCTQFVLYKENLSTVEAIAKLVTRKQKTTTFCTANHQITRAKTSQLVTAWNWNPINPSENLPSQQVFIGNFTFAPKPLQPGQFMGNHYTIALRQVTGDEIHIKSSVETLKENGFINYFETECFENNRRLSMHDIGKNVITEQWLKAVNLILDPQFNCPEKLTGKKYVAFVNKTSQNAFESTKLLNKYSMESRLIFCLRKFGSNGIHRLAKMVSRTSRLNYVRAYQQFIWNMVASKRIAKFGLKPIIGDLVYASDSDRCDAASNVNRTVVFITEGNISNYTINDVLLPLPGTGDTIFPSNEVATWYTELLLADGVSDFKERIGSYTLSKEYRLLLTKPKELTWKFVRYDDAMMDLISSDLDRLLQRRKPKIVEDGAFLGLVLEFKLPPYSYASMALREIVKMDTSKDLEFPDTETQPSTSIVGESSEKPEVKRIKLEIN